jgi:hypothetical protein
LKKYICIYSEQVSLSSIKKAISIFLILLFGFNSFGLFFFYWGKIQLCKIKAEDYADSYYQLPEKTLTIFSSDDKDFQINDDHEIVADGHLYDIIKTEMRNGKKLYYVLSDQEEDGYVKQLTEWGKSNSEEKSLPTKAVGIHIGKYFEKVKYCPFAFSLLRVRQHVKLSNDLFQYISPLKIVFSPPPDLLVS